MSLVARRLAFGGMFMAVAAGAVVFAAVAGAATAPPPDPEPAVPSSVPVPEDPTDEAPPPRRYVAMGSVVATREDRIALIVQSREKPILVAVRPMTTVRINMQKSELAEIRRGDHAVVVGRPGPRGNMIAQAIFVARKPPPPQTT